MKADEIESEAEPAGDPYELALALSDRIQIDNVILAHCEATRSAAPNLLSPTAKISTVVSGISHARDVESKRLNIMISFVYRTTHEGVDEAEDPLNIRASFVLFYSVTSFGGITDEHVKAFAATNGVFNAWPYWREFVHSTTSRMGLPKPVVVPVFRLGPTKQAEQTGEATL